MPANGDCTYHRLSTSQLIRLKKRTSLRFPDLAHPITLYFHMDDKESSIQAIGEMGAMPQEDRAGAH